MKPREFYELVKRVRKAQKEYFFNRSTSSLNQAKILESELDAEINRVEAILRGLKEETAKQQTLSL